MKLSMPGRLMEEINQFGENSYPEEGAGLILGVAKEDGREARRILHMSNHFERDSRSHRYRLDPREILQAEELAEQLGLEVIGVFHSHPDHPAAPSQYDLDWAMPWYLYLITSIEDGTATESRIWRMEEDRSRMVEEQLEIEDSEA